MNKLIATLALGAALTVGALAPAAIAEPATAPAPAAPAAGQPAPDHAKMREAMEKLGLNRKQKMEVAKIMKNAKATNQDKMATMKQLEGVLTPQQMTQLKASLAAKAGK